MHENVKPFAARDIAALVLVAVIWGVNNLLAKYAVQHVPPLMASGVRFVIVTVALVMWLKPVRQWGLLAAVSVLSGALHFGIQYVGLAMAHDLTPMVIGMQLWIPFSVVFATLLLGERMGWRRAIGVGAAFTGVAATAFDASVWSQGLALLLVAIAAAFYGAAAVLVRRGEQIHPLTFQAWIAITSWPVLFSVSAVAEPGAVATMAAAHWTVWAAIAFGALASSVVANALMFQLVQRYEVSRTTPFLFLSPIVAIGLGVAVLRDPLTPQIMLGAVLTLAGVAMAALAERRLPKS